MAGFPIAWEATASIDHFPDTCPYSLIDIEDYLFGNHYRWVLREKPTTFNVSGPYAERRDAERRYWLFEARDRIKHEQWFVVVGTGKSPFNPAEQMKRWMYAQTNDDALTPEQFLDQEYREQLTLDARPR